MFFFCFLCIMRNQVLLIPFEPSQTKPSQTHQRRQRECQQSCLRIITTKSSEAATTVNPYCSPRCRCVLSVPITPYLCWFWIIGC
ncbi:hypothetical protein V8C35DRAFT_195377 [Trichoderma chlorosporum]